MSKKHRIFSIERALEETRRFIAKEGARADDLRPSKMVSLLAWYRGHEQKLLGMLAAEKGME